MYKHICLLLPLLLLNQNSFALPEEDRIYGGIAVIKLEQDPAQSGSQPYVTTGKKRVTVVRENNDWYAVVGLSVLRPKKEMNLNIKWQNKTSDSVNFNIAPKKYQESHLTISDKKKVNPPKQDWDRIISENKLIGRAKRYWLDQEPDFNFQLPAQGRFSSLYGLRRFLNKKPKNPHRGLDIAAPTGTPIVAPSKGVIIETGDFFYTGNTVFIAHGGGLVSMYSHLSKTDVKKGDKVTKGQKIGEIGATGRVTGPHLHWGVGLNGTWVNPIYFLDKADRPKTK